jgi:hypothetical protein
MWETLWGDQVVKPPGRQARAQAKDIYGLSFPDPLMAAGREVPSLFRNFGPPRNLQVAVDRHTCLITGRQRGFR